MKFNGERFIPGQTNQRLENDHLERYKFVFEYIQDLDKDYEILDLACGEGYGSFLLSMINTNNVTGVDISQETIEYAKNKYQKNNLLFIKGDVRNFNNNKQYDIIVSFETIEHVPFYEEVIKNYLKILKKNGKLFISSPNRIFTSPRVKKLNKLLQPRYFLLEAIK